MGLRPVTTRWFEVLTAGDDVARATEAIARTGRVQIESETEEAPEDVAVSELRKRLPEYKQLARRYQHFWPRDSRPPVGSPGVPGLLLERGLAAIRAWAEDADPIIERIESLEVERERLALLRELLEHAEGDLPDLARLADSHTLLSTRLLVLPSETPTPGLPRGTLWRRVDGPRRSLLLVVAHGDEAGKVDQAMEAVRARRIELPSWLPAEEEAAREAIAREERKVADALAEARAELEEVHETHDLRRAVYDITCLDWYVTCVPPARHTRNFALTTGWTDDPDLSTVRDAIGRAGLCALVRFAEPPPGRTAPMVLENPWWARPFEVFARLVGVPAQGEVDPSALLSVIAPLLFGYMFGDVGQGAVLVLVGLALRKRIPALRLLVPGGLSAMFFGFLFGSVFAVEGLIPALWIHPMEHPLVLLVASVAGGAVILLIGLLLGGLGALFQRRFGHWFLTEAPMIAMYLGLLGMVLEPVSGWVAVAGLAWFFVGTIVAAERRKLLTALGALGALVEHLLQLGVNTVSFARVGAFALAHAGLSAAIAGMMHGAGPVAGAIILVLGNLVILVIEGLVVSIQTTRLVLFEFFVRFLEAGGRAFSPLTPPDDDVPEKTSPRNGGHPAAARSET